MNQSTSRRKDGSLWSRSGCLTCKKRRKRCDESKPTCRNCARLGRACEGYGSTWTEPLDPSAGVFRQSGAHKKRRASPSSPPSTRSGSSDSPVSTLSNSLGSCSFSYGDDCTRPGNTANRPQGSTAVNNAIHTLGAIPASYGYISHLPSLEMHYLQYHVEQGSKLLANLETDENPLRALIIPRALSSPLLMEAVCAVSARHLANRSHDSLTTGNAAANYYIRTLRGLRRALAEHPASAFRDDTMLAVAFLCKYEVVRGSVKQWAVHLDALQRLVISRGGFACIDREAAEFLWGLLMYAHNVAKITNRSQFRAVTAAPNNVRLTKLDIYVGYTEELIKTCARIADIPFLDADCVAVGLEVHAIDESLQSHSHTRSTSQYIIPKGTTPATLARLQMVADCFHDAAYIYLHSTLERMAHAQQPHPPPPQAAAAWSSLTSVSKPDALRCCLSRIRAFSPLDSHCEYSALTFPLFIAGCAAVERGEREIVVSALGALERNFGIGNVQRVRELLGVLWEWPGMGHWLDVLEELQWDLILA